MGGWVLGCVRRRMGWGGMGRGEVEGEAYGAFQLDGLEVGGMVWLEFDGAGVEGGEEGFGEGEFGHCGVCLVDW